VAGNTFPLQPSLDAAVRKTNVRSWTTVFPRNSGSPNIFMLYFLRNLFTLYWLDRWEQKGGGSMLKPGKRYGEVYQSFQWMIPEYYNIGVDICDKWANQRYRLALIYEDEKGTVEKYTFWDLKKLSDKLANALRAYGIDRGDRVGILLPQCPETAISHIAVYKIGAIAIPLFTWPIVRPRGLSRMEQTSIR
jgi:hypothetical protein